MHLNNPFVASCARSLVGQRYAMIAPELQTLVFEAIDKTLANSPAGWVYSFAVELGAKEEKAEQVGVIAVLLYAVTSLTDDIQDGDVERNYGWTVGRAIGVQTALLLMVQDLSLQMKVGMTALGLAMISGQHEDLKDGSWTMDRYHAVASLVAGEAFQFYFDLVTRTFGEPSAVGVDMGIALRNLGYSFGVVLQFVTDWYSKDRRLLSLGVEVMTGYFMRICDALNSALHAVDRLMADRLKIESRELAALMDVVMRQVRVIFGDLGVVY